MTAGQRPYVRVYYEVIDDPRFAEVYDDDRLLATWLRLLLVADALYPAAAPIPQGTHMASVRKLFDAGILEPLSGHRYYVHGLAAERERRSDQARAAAAARYAAVRPQCASTAPAVHRQRGSTARRDETRRDEPRTEGTKTYQTRAQVPAREERRNGTGSPSGPVPLRDLLPPPPGHPAKEH